MGAVHASGEVNFYSLVADSSHASGGTIAEVCRKPVNHYVAHTSDGDKVPFFLTSLPEHSA
jgi:hypothetical protein